MKFGWESPDAKALRLLRISPVKKLEGLREMHEFLCRALTKRQRQFYFKLRQARQ
ncbi:MAG: hypothetical protein ACOY3D_07580 [Candidatus Omnitrophota bacterium]